MLLFVCAKFAVVLQLHLMPASSILGLTSNLSSFSHALRFTPNVSIGVIHDLYPTNSSQYNTVQARNLEEGRQKIPFVSLSYTSPPVKF